jgi:RNase H-like domain found in reverse transcriptase/Integrase zinc binding domain/Reverse transcriptase (RNA-dependent DNA polymerase)
MELAIKENEKKADLPVEKLLPEDLHDFLDVFDDNKANQFPESNVWDHKIDMKEEFEPKSFNNYNLTPEEQKELNKFLDEILDKGCIRPSQSSQASPFFFVKKKDGRLRPCQDYWYLNDWTIKNAYHLPLILEIMDKLKGAKYFLKFDIWWGYNNVWIQSGDKWKAAFKTNWGLYEPTVMFFGMCNSLATFQAMMDKIFKKEIKEDLIIVYMDDILAFLKTIDGHKKIELEKAWEYDLYFKAKKCKFRKQKIEYLELVVEEGKLAMDPAKLKGILDWPAPKTVKEVRSFIGFGNFYHHFVKGFSHLAHPLYDLLKKDKKFVWSEECQESFDQLKKWFTEKPVLIMPDHSKPFQIQVDSSLFATGGILTQMDTNGDRHPCAYLSKSLMKEQRNYDTGDRELLAIVRALKEWRHYIQGSGHTTIVLSDHDNLQHFKVPQTIGRWMARWTLYLSEFDIKLVHIPGKKNIQADSLSRRPDLCPQGTDNKDVIVLLEHLFVNLIDMELQKKIANAKNMDYDAAEAIKELLEQGPKEAKKDLMDWEVEEFEGENILFYKEKNYVPIDAELRREIVQRYHNHPTAGHPGELQTFNAVKEHYWWPGLWVFIKNYVQGCGTC